MQIHNKLTARLLSLVLSIVLVTTMTSATVFAAAGDVPLGRSGVGVSGITVGGDNATPGYETSDATTLKKAINDIPSGGTVKIGADINLGSTHVEIGHTFTLDLNGKTLSYNGNNFSAAIWLVGSANLTVTDSVSDGKISSSNQGGILIRITGGTFTISDGILETTGSSAQTIKNASVGSIVNVSGGTVMASGEAGSAIVNDQSGSVNISGGIVSASAASGKAISNMHAGKITISGTAKVTSANSADAEGTITLAAVPDPAAPILEIKDNAVVENTTATGFAVYFKPMAVTSANLSGYYTASPDTTVGKVHPEAVGGLPDYTGTQAAAPSDTPVAKTATSITLEAVTVAGETVEYAMSTTNTAPAAGWQDSTAFTGLSEATQYYFFARVKATTTHKAGTASAGTAIATVANTLPAAIALASAAKTGIAINDNPASAVPSGTRFVTTAEMAALDAAIAAAQAVADNTGSTQAEIAAAIDTLNTAVTAFNAVIKTGTYSGGGGGSSSGGSTPSGNVIDNPVGTKTAPPAIAHAVKNAVAKGITNASTYVTFNNYTALAPDGIKAILDSAAAATKGTNVKLNLLVNFDAGPKNQVTSRITLDPAKLASLVKENVKLGVRFNQKDDGAVQSVNTLFGKHFSNRIVSVVYDQRNTLAVNAEFCAKLNLAETFGTDKNLYFYTYDNTTNIYKRIQSPNYRVDKNGYAHITAPFGGSIIISDKPLTGK